MTRTLAFCVLGLCAFATSADSQRTGELRFVVTGVDANEGGHIRCALYSSEATWLDRGRAMRKAAARAGSARAACVFRNLPPGTYAIAALHDADDDREMDQNLVGIPEEGYAISNDAVQRIRPPDFTEASLRFDGERATTSAPMHY